MLTKVEIEATSVDERMKLAEMLWESVSRESFIEIPEWQSKILPDRLTQMEEHPERELSLEEFWSSLK